MFYPEGSQFVTNLCARHAPPPTASRRRGRLKSLRARTLRETFSPASPTRKRSLRVGRGSPDESDSVDVRDESESSDPREFSRETLPERLLESPFPRGDILRACLGRSLGRTGETTRFRPFTAARPTRPAKSRTRFVVSRPLAAAAPAAAPTARDAPAPSANFTAPAAISPAVAVAEAPPAAISCASAISEMEATLAVAISPAAAAAAPISPATADADAPAAPISPATADADAPAARTARVDKPPVPAKRFASPRVMSTTPPIAALPT